LQIASVILQVASRHLFRIERHPLPLLVLLHQVLDRPQILA
jgi:hypothetical protein